jgi:glycosyltransferase involved in cell wall biosynthesis
MEQCYVYIDELKCGDIGVTAAEDMASGKPTISWILPAVLERYPADFPIVLSNPDTIEQVLEWLIETAESRHQIEKSSRAYVERYHDIKLVVQDLKNSYNEIS